MRYLDGMEFATEEEAEEYFGKASYGYYTDSSFVQKTDSDNFKNSNYDKYFVEEPKNYIVMAYVNGGYLYIANRGVTYNICDAKRMTQAEAVKKSKSMSKKGAYNWEWGLG